MADTENDGKVEIVDTEGKTHRVFHVDARELELLHGWHPVEPLIDSLVK